MGRERLGEQPVERAGADALGGLNADLLDQFEEPGHPLALEGGDRNHGGVVHEKEFDTDAFQQRFELFLAGAKLGGVLDQVPLVDGHQARLFGLLDEPRDFLVLRGDARLGIDDEHAEVGAPDGPLRAHDAEDFNGRILLAARPDARGVDESVIVIVAPVGDIHGIAGGAGDVRDHGAAVLQDGVDEGGFADVGTPHDGDLHGRFDQGGQRVGLGAFGQKRLDLRDQVDDPAIVLRTDAENLLKPEPCKIEIELRVLFVIDFVDDEQDRFGNLAQPLGEDFVHGIESRLAVHHEEDHIGGFHGDGDLGFDLIGEARIDVGADAAGVDDLERFVFIPAAFDRDAVAGDARLIVDDGNAAASEPVE